MAIARSSFRGERVEMVRKNAGSLLRFLREGFYNQGRGEVASPAFPNLYNRGGGQEEGGTMQKEGGSCLTQSQLTNSVRES